MSDYWSVIDDIRTVLENTQSIYPEHREMLRKTSLDYNAAVNEVNGRLRQAIQYLRKGNIGEAHRLVETEPNLFDTFAVLDFPERTLWEDVLAAFELPPALSFHREIAKELSDALVQSAPLEPLLRKHRFLALALAPLSLRLATLREIAGQDPTNSAWGTDIEAYERERILELCTEVETALRNPDIPKLTLLESELTSPDWRIARPEDLLSRVQRELRSLKTSATVVSLRNMAEQLLSAYDSRDLHRALPLRDSWNELQRQLGMPIPSELQRQVLPAFNWLRLDDESKKKALRFREELERLEDALEQGDKPDELIRLQSDVEDAAEDAGTVIPAAVMKRLEGRLAAARNKAASRRKVFIFGGAITAAFALTLIVLLIVQASRLQDVSGAVKEIRAVINNHSPATRPKSYDTLEKYTNPDNPFSQNPSVKKELEELKKLLDED